MENHRHCIQFFTCPVDALSWRPYTSLRVAITLWMTTNAHWVYKPNFDIWIVGWHECSKNIIILVYSFWLLSISYHVLYSVDYGCVSALAAFPALMEFIFCKTDGGCLLIWFRVYYFNTYIDTISFAWICEWVEGWKMVNLYFAKNVIPEIKSWEKIKHNLYRWIIGNGINKSSITN